MGTLVWTTPSQIRFQINRVNVYPNNYSNSFFERNNDYCGGCAYIEIEFLNRYLPVLIFASTSASMRAK